MTQFDPEALKTRRQFLHLAGAGATAGLGAAALDPRSVHASTGAHPRQFLVTAYGAVGDGKTIDSPAINRAIDAAAAAGGGTVVFPAGTYLCYSIRLKSHVTLAFEPGATILAADGAQYDPAGPKQPWEAYQDFGHNHWHNSLLWGEGLENIAITGPGLIYGKGLSKGYGPGPKAEDPGVGNKAIALKNCHNVLLRDFAIQQGGHFGILATGVDSLTVNNLVIDTNRDGMDIDCCRNVRITNCTVNSPWDDGICLKSSFALGYARPTENVTISNCYVSGCWQLGSVIDGTWKKHPPGAEVYWTGRIKLGTESNGGFLNIAIANCIFEGCQGLALETVDGAHLEDIAVTNLTMRDITTGPLFLRLGARLRGPKATTKAGTLRRVSIANIVCTSRNAAACSILSGIPGAAMQDVNIHDVQVLTPGGGTAQQAALQPPEAVAKYPEPDMFGAMPAYGFYIRHLQGLSLANIAIKTQQPDARPAIVLQDVSDARLFQIRARQADHAPLLALQQVTDFAIRYSDPVPDTSLAQAQSVHLPAGS
jgi:polygalacturonase